MSDSYTKISLIDALSLNDVKISDENTLVLSGIGADGELLPLIGGRSLISFPNTIPPNTFHVATSAQAASYTFEYTPTNSHNKCCYYTFNETLPAYKFIDDAISVTLHPTINQHIFNAFTIGVFNYNAFQINNDDAPVKSYSFIDKSCVKTLKIVDENTTNIVLNLPNLQGLSIISTKKLEYLEIGNCTNLEQLFIIGTSISGCLTIGTLYKTPNITLANNKITHLVINGNASIMNLTTFVVMEPNLKFVRFNNCDVNQDLLDSLERRGIKAELDDKCIITDIDIELEGYYNIVIVDSLPETGEADTIYLVPLDPPVDGNRYDEWIWEPASKKWERFGPSTIVDYPGYAKLDEENTFIGSQTIDGNLTVTSSL